MTNNKQSGFTLIELIVVMAILVLLSVISYRALVTALDTRQIVTQYNEQLREFELGLFLLARDLNQIHQSPLKGDMLPFSSQLGQGEHQSGKLFTLLRAADAQMLRGAKIISYTLKDGQIWQQIGDEDEGLLTPIFGGIESLRIRFHNKGNIFHQWQTKELPDLVEVELNHKRYGKIVIKERLHAL